MMDSITGLSFILRRKDVVWINIDRLTKLAHFLPVRANYLLEKLAELYINEIVWLYSMPISIILDRPQGLNPDFRKNNMHPWILI